MLGLKWLRGAVQCNDLTSLATSTRLHFLNDTQTLQTACTDLEIASVIDFAAYKTKTRNVKSVSVWLLQDTISIRVVKVEANLESAFTFYFCYKIQQTTSQ